MSIPRYRTILYASDLGNHMRPVFRHAVSLARQYHARIVMLHVVEPLGTTGEWVLNAYLPGKTRELEKKALKKVLKQMRRRLEKFYQEELDAADQEARLVSDIVVVSGEPAEEILRQAAKRQADLIVVGTHTGVGTGLGLLGSTARKLTQYATHPLLVVPVAREQ